MKKCLRQWVMKELYNADNNEEEEKLVGAHIESREYVDRCN